MKTLIINGSPRASGHSADIIKILSAQIGAGVTVVSAFNNILPCNDCGTCKKTVGCFLTRSDSMRTILDNSFNNVIIVSPIHHGDLPGPMINIKNRFQFEYINKKHSLGGENVVNPKFGAIIIVAGGTACPVIVGKKGAATLATNTAKFISQKLGCGCIEKKNIIQYLKTDDSRAIENVTLNKKIIELVKRIKTKKLGESA